MATRRAALLILYLAAAASVHVNAIDLTLEATVRVVHKNSAEGPSCQIQVEEDLMFTPYGGATWPSGDYAITRVVSNPTLDIGSRAYGEFTFSNAFDRLGNEVAVASSAADINGLDLSYVLPDDVGPSGTRFVTIVYEVAGAVARSGDNSQERQEISWTIAPQSFQSAFGVAAASDHSFTVAMLFLRDIPAADLRVEELSCGSPCQSVSESYSQSALADGTIETSLVFDQVTINVDNGLGVAVSFPNAVAESACGRPSTLLYVLYAAAGVLLFAVLASMVGSWRRRREQRVIDQANSGVVGMSPYTAGAGSVIHRMVSANQYAEVRRLIDDGIDVNSTEHPEKATPLHVAVGCNFPQIVHLLLENNANINAVDAENNTPLHIAAQIANTSVVTELIARGAITSLLNRMGLTPIALAATDAVASLLASDADGALIPTRTVSSAARLRKSSAKRGATIDADGAGSAAAAVLAVSARKAQNKAGAASSEAEAVPGVVLVHAVGPMRPTPPASPRNKRPQVAVPAADVDEFDIDAPIFIIDDAGNDGLGTAVLPERVEAAGIDTEMDMLGVVLGNRADQVIRRPSDQQVESRLLSVDSSDVTDGPSTDSSGGGPMLGKSLPSPPTNPAGVSPRRRSATRRRRSSSKPSAGA